MRVIVTGGAGFIGSHLVDALIDQEHEVYVLDDLTSGNSDTINDAATFTFCDISNIHQVRQVFRMIRPQVIYHQAASKCNACERDPERDLNVNALGTLNLLRVSAGINVQKFIHASTGSVYGTDSNPVAQSAGDISTTPLTYYGVSKLAGEKYVTMFRKRGLLDTVVLRYFHVYGPRQRDAEGNGGVIGIFCRRALEGQPLQIFGDGKQVRCFTYVGDVVTANLWCAKSKTQSVYNCVSDQRVTINQLAALVARRKKGTVTEHLPARPGEVRMFQIAESKLPLWWTPIDEGLKKTFNWYKEKYGHSSTITPH